MTRRMLVAAGAAVVVGLSVAGALGAARDSDPVARIEPEVLRSLEAGKGEATYWIVLREKANLAPAFAIRDRAARGRFVHDRLTSAADRSQAGLRNLLARRGVAFRPFWIANAIRVTGNEPLLRELAKRPEVERIAADRVFRIPEPLPGTTEPGVQAVEWNIDRIRAPLAWSTFGTRGEGIVVANIDTGVQFNHPALVRQYRGNLGGGAFDHNYNWFDPSTICGSPSLVPCDNNGHGTHTIGTIVGDDGDPGPNQIGVAPHARWIAAKGCEFNSCSLSALLASGQWILAPTDLNGQNPRPDLRPHVVNNSWGGGGGSTFYQDVVNAWLASGIFPAFSNGNSGPGCGTSGSPGDYVESFSSGAFDINNAIAGFSSRGPSGFGGEIKPNIAAPGVSVRSSVPTSTYASFSGTSMASPHVAGTVALIWSAAPSIERDVAATRSVLDESAVDVSNTTCGGTAADNNVWGEGRLDAFAAVERAPRGPTGTLTGTVTDADTGAAIAGATVEVAGPTVRSTTTSSAGRYSLRLPVGLYDVTVHSFGYRSQTAAGVAVSQDATTVRDFALAAAPAHAVSGTVRTEAGAPVANATVTILGTPIPPATTDAAGAYTFASVPEGSYDVRAEAGRCTAPQTRQLALAGGPATLDFALPERADEFGYRCEVVPAAFVAAGTVLPLSGDDSVLQVSLPFPFPFYDRVHTTAWVSTNGYVNFLGANSVFANGSIPSAAAPNAAVYPFWDDLFIDAEASVRTAVLGSSPNRRFVIEWRNAAFFSDFSRRVRVEAILHESGELLFQYADLAADSREQGGSATVGLENHAGTVAFQYSFDEAVLSGGVALLFRAGPADSGFVQGRVTDRNDGLGIAGATVRALQGGAEAGSTTTGADGSYRLALAPGTYTVEAGAARYGSGTASVVVEEVGQVVVRDFSLPTARIEVAPTSLEFFQPAGSTRTAPLSVANTGTASTAWQLVEVPEESWLSASPTSGSLAPGGSQQVQVTATSAGLAAGTYTATLRLDSTSGRQPQVGIPVRLLVTAYDQRLNVGGPAYTDVGGAVWVADQAFDGNFGFTRAATPVSTTSPIAGTADDPLYQRAKVGRQEYHFERLSPGTYEVELRFAEIEGRSAGERVFDVFVQGDESVSLTSHDVAAEVGQLAADDHRFLVRVRDRLQIRLEGRTGEPILAAIRVLHRPDL
jgi:subtilisin family serine protease